MARFEEAVEYVFADEGGYSKDPDDPGGETRFGISKRYNPDVDIYRLTRREATEIYRRKHWRKEFAQIRDQDVLNKYFSLLVNLGAYRATQALQRAARELAITNLAVDGKLGPKTLNAVNACLPAQLLCSLKVEAAEIYARLCQRDSKKLKYLVGWIRRVVR